VRGDGEPLVGILRNTFNGGWADIEVFGMILSTRIECVEVITHHADLLEL
jgi:hypothetical protein